MELTATAMLFTSRTIHYGNAFPFLNRNRLTIFIPNKTARCTLSGSRVNESSFKAFLPKPPNSLVRGKAADAGSLEICSEKRDCGSDSAVSLY